jgi:hypothetical protein
MLTRYGAGKRRGRRGGWVQVLIGDRDMRFLRNWVSVVCLVPVPLCVGCSVVLPVRMGEGGDTGCSVFCVA